MSDCNKKIGYRIADVRGKAGESQADLAAALGVKREMVTYWEKGTRPIKADTIVEIARKYGVSADYLLGLTAFPALKDDMKMAHKVTGLSNTAIKALQNVKAGKYPFDINTVDILFETQDGFDFFASMKRAFDTLVEISKYTSACPEKIEEAKQTDILERDHKLAEIRKELEAKHTKMFSVLYEFNLTCEKIFQSNREELHTQIAKCIEIVSSEREEHEERRDDDG